MKTQKNTHYALFLRSGLVFHMMLLFRDQNCDSDVRRSVSSSDLRCSFSEKKICYVFTRMNTVAYFYTARNFKVRFYGTRFIRSFTGCRYLGNILPWQHVFDYNLVSIQSACVLHIGPEISVDMWIRKSYESFFPFWVFHPPMAKKNFFSPRLPSTKKIFFTDCHRQTFFFFTWHRQTKILFHRYCQNFFFCFIWLS